MPARLRLAAAARTALRFVAPSPFASFRYPPRCGAVMQSQPRVLQGCHRAPRALAGLASPHPAGGSPSHSKGPLCGVSRRWYDGGHENPVARSADAVKPGDAHRAGGLRGRKRRVGAKSCCPKNARGKIISNRRKGQGKVGSLADCASDKVVVENNSLSGDAARETVKQVTANLKDQVRDKLGEGTLSAIVNSIIGTAADTGDAVLGGADYGADAAMALTSCAMGDSYCTQALSDLAGKNQAAADTLKALMKSETWEAVAGQVKEAAQGNQLALEATGGMLAGLFLPGKKLPDTITDAGKVSGGSLSGQPTKLPPNASPENIRSLQRENEGATILSQNGYHVEQNPVTPGVKNPDYKINGEVFDNIAPKTNSVRNIYDRALEKVNSGQTNNVVINLADTKASVSDLQKQFNDWPINGLDKIIVIDQSGKPIRIK
ncbi:hypothetical protein C7420_10192 [Pantoea ananatis]|nr:hypothetical protein C7420_10192 [Pantoea ananatis]